MNAAVEDNMFKQIVPVVVILVQINAQHSPNYAYRYESEDLMKSASSQQQPMHGYRMIESDYYPSSSSGRYTSIHHDNFFNPMMFGSTQRRHFHDDDGGFRGYWNMPRSFGADVIDRRYYGDDKKLANDGGFDKRTSVKQAEGKEDQEGYKRGRVYSHNDKNEGGSYHDGQGLKDERQDERNYQGGQRFNQADKSENEQKQNEGHKKGHKVKGFKTTHHKDESGKTEEYFDEENDEGGRYNYNGKTGQFGANANSQYTGDRNNGHFNHGRNQKQGYYDTERSINNSNGDQGGYGENKFYTNGRTYGANNGFDQQSILGHQENNQRFYKNHHHVPFYHHY